MNEQEEIFFGADSELTVREAFVQDAIQRMRESVIGSCKKCEGGFVTNAKRIRTVEDLVSDSASECECRIRAFRMAKRMASGFPKQFLESGLIPMPLDSKSKEAMELYLSKIEKAYDKCIGVFFVGQENHNGQALHYARTICAINILIQAIEKPKPYSVHYISMPRYLDLKIQAMKKNNDFLEELLQEIDRVDFLCLDGIDYVKNTEYVGNSVRNLIAERSFQGRPNILVTNMTAKRFEEQFGAQTMEFIYGQTVCIQIERYSGKQLQFVDLKKQLF